MTSVKYIIELIESDRNALTDLVTKGTSPAKAILRANILLASDRNSAKHMTVAEIAETFHTTPTTVQTVKTTYAEKGLDQIIIRKKRKIRPYRLRLQETLKHISSHYAAAIPLRDIHVGQSGFYRRSV